MSICENHQTLNVSRTQYYYIKLLMLFNGDNKEYTLLYGFCVPTQQPVFSWKFEEKEKTKISIWKAILEKKEADEIINKLSQTERIHLGKEEFTSPQLVKRSPVIINDGMNHTDGPISGLCYVTEYWNTNKKELHNSIKLALAVDGKDLLQNIQCIFSCIQEECGIDFSKDGARAGNFEYFIMPKDNDKFTIETHKECGLKCTTVLKHSDEYDDLMVNCTSEHRGRTILNQTKILKTNERRLDFFADEAMSRVIIQIWNNSGKLIFSEEITLCLSISIDFNVGSAPIHVQDPWSEKLIKSASDHSGIIKKQILTVSKTTQDRAISINSNELENIDIAMQEGHSLFSMYKKCKEKGAFVQKIEMDGEINSFIKLREYIEHSAVKKVIIADPFFSIPSAQKMLFRIQRTDVELEVITSLTGCDPDTGEKKDILEHYRKFLETNSGVLHSKLIIRNLHRGNTQVFHDRYLIRILNDGRIDGFLLSNSLNSMGQFYPFVIAPMDKTVCYQVFEYLNELCDDNIQATRPKKQRIVCETLWDYKTKVPSLQSVMPEKLPFNSWLPANFFKDGELCIKADEVPCVVTILWNHWNTENKLACKMISALGLNTCHWDARDVAEAIRTIECGEGAYCLEFENLAKEIELQQNHQARGVESEVCMLWALLNNKAEPNRQGFHLIVEQAGHIYYPGNSWLHGGYTLLLSIDVEKYVRLINQLKSPLMFDVLATQMLFQTWSEILYLTAIKSSVLCIKLLCAEILFEKICLDKIDFSQLKQIIEKLVPNDRALQITYIVSRLVFCTRTSRNDLQKVNECEVIYKWLMMKLANDLPLCDENERQMALYWLYDCEACSNCKLHLDLAEVENDCQIKAMVYNEALSVANEDLKNDVHNDKTEIIDLYLDVAEKCYKEKVEASVLKDVVNWKIFETATEPSLKNYAYEKWHNAYIHATNQLQVLKAFLTEHPNAEKAKEWLNYWEPRMETVQKTDVLERME